jgi:hypothetical protein
MEGGELLYGVVLQNPENMFLGILRVVEIVIAEGEAEVGPGEVHLVSGRLDDKKVVFDGFLIIALGIGVIGLNEVGGRLRFPFLGGLGGQSKGRGDQRGQDDPSVQSLRHHLSSKVEFAFGISAIL